MSSRNLQAGIRSSIGSRSANCVYSGRLIDEIALFLIIIGEGWQLFSAVRNCYILRSLIKAVGYGAAVLVNLLRT